MERAKDCKVLFFANIYVNNLTFLSFFLEISLEKRNFATYKIPTNSNDYDEENCTKTYHRPYRSNWSEIVDSPP